MKHLGNFLAFQAGWFSCVLGAANGAPWLGPIVVLLIVGWHLGKARRPGGEAILLGLAFLTGLLFDSLLLASGWLSYPNGEWIPGLAPYWIVMMWPLFATTLNRSMRFLRDRMVLAMLLGAVGGPLSYLAGERLGAVSLLNPQAAVAALGVAWGLFTPLLMIAAARLDGFSHNDSLPYIQRHWGNTRA